MSAAAGERAPWRDRLVFGAARAWLTLRHPFAVARFARKLGYVPDPALPRSYNELLLWRRLADHNPLFVTLSDKLAAKDYIRARRPDITLPRTLWVGTAAHEIPRNLLAGDVIVKASHGWQMNLVVRRGTPSADEVVRQAGAWLRTVHGRRTTEWAYTQVTPRLFVEELLMLGGPGLPTEAKVHICDGIVSHIWVEDRIAGKALHLDPLGNPLPGRDHKYPGENQTLAYTPRIGELVRQAVEIARDLGRGLDYVRVDFLVTEAGLYAGEMTIYSAAGHGTWSNPAIAGKLAQLWDIRGSHFLKSPHRWPVSLYAETLRAEIARRKA